MKLKKSLGQHFMQDKNILALEARLLNPKGACVLEIGPGDGRLTEQLMLAGAKKVLAVEKDRSLIPLLEKRFQGQPVEILNQDFLELQPKSFPKGLKIIGNIPYYISSDIIFRLKYFDFSDALLMIQHEFARKMVARPGSAEYGRLSVTSQLFYEVKYQKKVPAHLFVPAPKVDSAIISLKKSGIQLPQSAEDTIRALFQHKNKTVRNALLDSGYAREYLTSLELPLQARPRALTLEQIVDICKKIGEIKTK